VAWWRQFTCPYWLGGGTRPPDTPNLDVSGEPTEGTVEMYSLIVGTREKEVIKVGPNDAGHYEASFVESPLFLVLP
jgi:hypothetical protein